VREENRVLTDPSFGLRKRTVTDLANRVAEAQRALLRIKNQALAKDVQARCDLAMKRSLHLQELTRHREIEDEITKCKIVSPQDGMVVYCLPEQLRHGGGMQQSIVAQGEPVREGQRLMEIPNLKRMIVTTYVHEAMVARLRRGLRATVHVDAYPGRAFRGHVEQVATVAGPDWYSDVKVFATKVAIDEVAEGMKPGMSAEATIEIGSTFKPMLTVPVTALLGSVEMGNHRHCYVLEPDGAEERDVVVGLSNKQMVEIKEGLDDGDEVVLNPGEVEGDTIKTHKASPLATLRQRSHGHAKQAFDHGPKAIAVGPKSS
jgi:HlyD family secretion protein